ncbi:MAG: hypothetical protein LBI96_07465, partial [Odoribacteraceae bacterium]|nr:hypothetical protein [Odoribacteraceae bacterium]
HGEDRGSWKGKGEATFTLEVPALLDNYGKGAAWESAVREVDVLLFDNNNRLIYRTAGFNITDDKNNSTTRVRKRVTAKLRDEGNSNRKYQAVAVVNARETLAELPADSLLNRPTYDELLESLTFELPGREALEARGVPMWGICSFEMDDLKSGTLPEISLTRAAARVDVRVGYYMQGKLSLESVHLYRYNRAGSVAPPILWLADNFTPVEWSGDLNGTTHLPDPASLPDGETPLTVDGPLSFAINDDPTNPVTSFKQGIYVHEADAGTTDGTANVCLVVGGYFSGEEVPVYYRVDFRTIEGEYFPLLRDHRYLVTVHMVGMDGHATKEEALASQPQHPGSIGVSAFPWDEAWDDSDSEVIISDPPHLGVYMMKALNFELSGGSLEMLVFSNVGKWSVQEKPDWITISPDEYAEAVPQTVTVTADALASGSREGYFYIASGYMKRKITVTQQ